MALDRVASHCCVTLKQLVYFPLEELKKKLPAEVGVRVPPEGDEVKAPFREGSLSLERSKSPFPLET